MDLRIFGCRFGRLCECYLGFWRSCVPISDLTTYHKEGQNRQRGIYFPLEAEYNRKNSTLEGRIEVPIESDPLAVLDSLETPVNKLVAPERDSDSLSADFGAAERTPVQGDSADVGAPQALPEKEAYDPAAPDERSPHGYSVDAFERRYPIDEFGARIRRSSRPKGAIPEEWNKLSKMEKDEFIKVYSNTDESTPAVPTWSFSDPDKHWNDVSMLVQAFEDDLACLEREYPRAAATATRSTKPRHQRRSVSFSAVPAMPGITPALESHRPKRPNARFLHAACVARPVGKQELESSEKAMEARDAERNRL